MKKLRNLIILVIAIILILIVPNISNAAIEVNKERPTNDGSIKYTFTGLTLDKTHEYEFGFAKSMSSEIEKWHLISKFTETTAIVNISGVNVEFTNIITAVDTGYITIKDKTTDTTIVEAYEVDLTVPYLNITNYQVINNGKTFGNSLGNGIQINCWNKSNSNPYYQYEKITDENVINKYKEIKRKNGNYKDLQSLLKTTAPTSGWKSWSYWNGYGNTTTIGYGYTESNINLSDSGLYYMWIYLAGNNIKNLYGYILVDNLEPEIALDSITLPKTAEVELGKTLKLTPTFNPVNTTNKIVTWTSSDETVATVNNAGNITPKKIGSTIITVTSQEGNKKATCTVTVVAQNSGNNGGNSNNNGGTNQGNSNNGSSTTDGKDDQTTAKGTLPKTGIGIELGVSILILLVVGGYLFSKYKWYKDIK